MLIPCAVVELVWQDASGSTATTTTFCPSSSSVAEIDASATALASILVPLTGAVLVRQRIKYIATDSEPVLASGSTPVRKTGSFFFDTEDNEAIALIVVRALKPSLILSEGNEAGVGIDTDNSDVISFVNAVIDNNVTNPFGDDVTDFNAAYVQSRV